MLLETYRKIKNYLYREVVDIAIKQEMPKKKQNNKNNQYVKSLNNKTSLNKSNYNLIKKERS